MILIIDDDPSVVASLSLLLKRHGHPARGARSQEEALASLREQDLDLVIQDMNFSRGTGGEEGLELLAEIRRLRPRLPVILITAWGSIGLAVEGMKAGASDFVTKPWNNARLVAIVQAAAASRRPAATPEPRGSSLLGDSRSSRRIEMIALVPAGPTTGTSQALPSTITRSVRSEEHTSELQSLV